MSEEGKKAPGTGAKKRRRILRRVIVTVLVLLVLGSAGLYAYARLKEQYTVTYDAYSATTGTISNSLSFSGTLALRYSATYTASSGTVRAVYVAAGDTVRKGDRLVRLSTGTTCTADYDGRVNVVNVSEGDEITGNNTTLVQIADFEHMMVSFRVDEYDISDVQVGDACTVTATAAEKSFSSRVETINYISGSSGNVAYYTATAWVDVSEGIYPGMQVTVTIPQEEATNVVVLKADALSFSDANQAFVYVMGEDGAMKEQNVEVGVSNGNYVEIRAGLKDGDVVYAVAETETSGGLTSLFSSMFGGQRVNNGNRTNRQSSGSGSGQRSTESGSGSGSGSGRPSGGGPSGGSAGGGN